MNHLLFCLRILCSVWAQESLGYILFLGLETPILFGLKRLLLCLAKETSLLFELKSLLFHLKRLLRRPNSVGHPVTSYVIRPSARHAKPDQSSPWNLFSPKLAPPLPSHTTLMPLLSYSC